jgi:UDP-N-acetylglucosamine--N-acetylmuramyl-(pentapeptide) pyrophosphoryl-undecaprenol N-acetylglucosamine transferase
MEERIVTTESSLPYRTIPTAALRGRGPLALLRNVGLMLAGTLAAAVLLRQLRPAAILGTGGYGCVPVFLAARLLRIPTLLYLPDVVPGMAVRFLSRLATQVACSTEASRPYFRAIQPASPSPDDGNDRTNTFFVSGYPVREALYHQDRAACRHLFGLDEQEPVLLVYGGSRGARSINRAVETLLPDILELTQVIHVCGREGDEVWLRAAAERLEPRLQARYWLAPYLESSEQRNKNDNNENDRNNNEIEADNRQQPSATMVAAFGAADLALCRSGASVLGELPALGLPAVLIPYPYVHQDENAEYLVQHGAAIKISDAAMLGEKKPQEGPLFRELYRLLKTDTRERLQMARQSRALARPDAAHRLANALRQLATLGTRSIKWK